MLRQEHNLLWGGETASRKCPKCHSKKIWKDGKRKIQNGKIQRYICRKCDYRFSESAILSTKSNNNAGCQVCAYETKVAKNLAKVENQTKDGLAGATTNDTKSLLFNYAWWMKKQGYAPSTITTRERILRILAKRGANLNDSDSVKEAIANQEWCNKRKVNAVDAYTVFLKMQNRTWNPPRYRVAQKLPFIPKEEEIDALIAGCGPKTSTFLQLLKETAMRAGEAHRTTWEDIDFETSTVRVTPEKGSNAGMFKLSPRLMSRLLELKVKNKTNHIFSKHLRTQRRLFQKQRARLAIKLQNPRLKQIHFHTLRHWKATKLCHQTNGNIYYVMKFLRHKNIKNTMTYIHLAEVIFNEVPEYLCEPANTVEEAKALIEKGFSYECEIDNVKLFKKVKTSSSGPGECKSGPGEI